MKRLIGMIPVFIGVMLLIFVLLRVVPGDPVQVLLGEHYSQDTIDRLTKAMNLDKPVFEQFLLYLSGVFHGDLGMSYVMKKPVTSLIMEALPQTVILALMASVFAWFVGIGSGIIAAIIFAPLAIICLVKWDKLYGVYSSGNEQNTLRLSKSERLAYKLMKRILGIPAAFRNLGVKIGKGAVVGSADSENILLVAKNVKGVE